MCLRHSTAHLMAQAVQSLFPGTQVTIGPTIEHGFYYDFKRDQPFSPEDLELIEKRMQELAKANLKVAREELPRAAGDRAVSQDGRDTTRSRSSKASPTTTSRSTARAIGSIFAAVPMCRPPARSRLSS